MADVLDYSWARPSPQAMAAAGYSGVMRYISREPSKNLSVRERDALFAHRLSVGLVWETTASAPLGGYATGVQHAMEANAQADALDWPANKALIYAVDFDPTTVQLPTIGAYFNGVKSVRGRPVGVYGSFKVCEWVAENSPVHCYWQCAAWSGRAVAGQQSLYVPSYGYNVRVSRHACLFQFYGSERVAQTDHNVTLNSAHAGGVSDLLWHPELSHDDHDELPPEEDLMTKAVFCPDHTGAAGWLPMLVNGVRYRQGYGSADELAADAGLVEGSIELRGRAAELFLSRYTDGVPYGGPQIVWNRTDSTWATEVAGLQPGQQARFIIHPSGVITWVNSDKQRDVDVYVGVKELGEIDDVFFYNGVLLPWAVRPGEVEVTAAVELTNNAVEAVATRSAELVHADLAD